MPVNTHRHHTRRADVQGLRAVAVLAVIAYHSGLPVQGGFLGVDIFFVISGYVITTMLLREQSITGNIGLKRFYARRFKRLVPALSLVILFTLIVSSVTLSPLGSQQLVVETAKGAQFLNANRVIAENFGKYFDPAAESNPLLHTWTLSVEEQFYLFFPVLLLMVWKLRARIKQNKSILSRKFVPLVIIGFTALITLLSVTIFTDSWLSGFYGPTSRAWEFSLGAVVATLGIKLKQNNKLAGIVTHLLGVILVGFSLFVFNESTPTPSIYTLVPTLGTALLLIMFNGHNNVIKRILSARYLVAIGNCSYSLYLWHWPFIVFSKVLWPEISYAPFYAAVLSIFPAIAAYRWIEQPLRSIKLRSHSISARFALFVLMPPLLVGFLVQQIANEYWRPQYEAGGKMEVLKGDVNFLGIYNHFNNGYFECTDSEIRQKAQYWEEFVRCQQSHPDNDVTMAIIGDSHAEALFVGLANLMPNQNVVYYMQGGDPYYSDPDFKHIYNSVIDSKTIHTVLISGWWESMPVKENALIESIQVLTANGKRVFVTDDVPDFNFQAFGCKFKPAIFQPANCTEPFDKELHGSIVQQLKRITEQITGSDYIKTYEALCMNDTCSMARENYVLYRDNTHLNVDGSKFIAKYMLDNNPQLNYLLSK